jgi:transposase
VKDSEALVESHFVGLNATSTAIEVAIRPTGEIWKTHFADDSIEETVNKLKCLQPKLVVMEAAGACELPVAGLLAIHGLPFAVVNPRNVREFARAVSGISRSDHTTAGLLAHFGELVDPEPRPFPEELIEKLKQLRTRREQVMQMLLAERENLQAASPPGLKNEIQRHIVFLEQNISSLNQEFNRNVRSSAAWR